MSASTDGYREKTLSPDSAGEYWVEGLVEGASVRFLVDTGATYVSLSSDMAARAGVRPDSSAPQARMQTANGMSDAYQVTLKNISLGSMYMSDVPAVVLAPERRRRQPARVEFSQSAGERREAQRPADHAPIGKVGAPAITLNPRLPPARVSPAAPPL